MLSRVHQNMFDVPLGIDFVVLMNGGHQGGDLHEVGTGADDGDDFHLDKRFKID